MTGFLFDENLPTKVRFTPRLPVSHVLDLGPNPTDSAIWDHARQNKLVIVTKDADFSLRIITKSPPPWVVHLRIGNMRQNEFQEFLARTWPVIEATVIKCKLVNVYADRVEGVG